jgi:hypothetical protein
LCWIHAGADEGAFAWLTLNYLLGHLGGDESNTVAAIDMGGGSVQMAYAVDDATAKRAPSGYIFKLKGGGKNYNVYVRRLERPFCARKLPGEHLLHVTGADAVFGCCANSQLGYGIMAGRAAVLDTTQVSDGFVLPHH